MYVLLENINHENFPGKAEHTIRIYRSAVLKYYEFLKSIDEVL